MASPKDIDMGDESSNVHRPFTVEESIYQLNSIDKAIVDLMNHTSTALNSLTTATSSDSTASAETPAEAGARKDSQKEAFKSATDTFLTTLHDIDVKMKRQIFALEEAGIVSLSTGQRLEQGASKASFRPNGMGTVGNLDVGWLNSRGTRVERDMEAELWSRTRLFLEREGDRLKPS